MLGHDHYIYRLRAACMAQPHLNRHQLAALDRELEFVRAAATPEEHLKASGDMVGLARAAAMDRAANDLDIALRYDDPWTAAAAAIEYVHAQESTNHVDLYTNIQRGHQRAAALRTQAAEIQSAFATLFLNLLHVNTSNFELEQAHAAIHTSFQTLQTLDSAFLPRTWIEQPRYHRRLPWHSELVHDWFASDWPNNAPAPPTIEPNLIQPGHWGTLDWPSAEPLDAPPDTAIADIYLTRQSEWPDPALAAHWQTTKQALQEARSPIAQCAVATGRQALFSIESLRHLLEFGAFLAPLRAAANHGWQQDEDSQAGLHMAIDTATSLTGLTPRQILDTPRIQHFLQHNIIPRLELGNEGFGALAGEPGFDLLRHAYPCHAVTGGIDFRDTLLPRST